jgi:apolipoprotein N-acyltransferase
VRERLQGLGWWPLAAIAFTGSLVLGLASPPSRWTVLLWLGFAPLVLVARIKRDARLRSLFGLGWVGGLCTGLVGFPWIAHTLIRFAEAPAWAAYMGLFAFAAWTAIPFGIFVAAVARGPTRGWAAYLWPIAVWVGVSKVFPALFPYTPMIGIAEVPEWMQLAELGGVPLVEAQVIVVGILIADGLLQTAGARWTRLAIAVVIPISSWGYGAWRIAGIDAETETAPTVRFGIVQPNTPLFMRNRQAKINRLHAQSRLAEDEGAQIMVWPEAGIFPFIFTRPYERDYPGRRQVLRTHKTPTVLGIPTKVYGEPYEYNTVVALGSDGKVTGTFDKNILVPFGEYIPIVDPDWARSIIPAMSHNNAGVGPARFPIAPRSLPDHPNTPALIHAGPLVCYEDIMIDFANEVAQQEGGIDVFINVTIDTWFGDTAEPWEHLALAQFRSVEHRIPMVRSVSAGASSVVDSAGRLQAHLPVRDPTYEEPVDAERLVVDVALPRNTAQRPTPFARGGWLLAWLCVVVAGVVPLARVVRSKYRARADDASPEE